MTGTLTEKQMGWLRGLNLAGGFVLMSASELGDPEVSTLQSLDLVQVSKCLDGYNWRISSGGEAKLKD